MSTTLRQRDDEISEGLRGSRGRGSEACSTPCGRAMRSSRESARCWAWEAELTRAAVFLVVLFFNPATVYRRLLAGAVVGGFGLTATGFLKGSVETPDAKASFQCPLRRRWGHFSLATSCHRCSSSPGPPSSPSSRGATITTSVARSERPQPTQSGLPQRRLQHRTPVVIRHIELLKDLLLLLPEDPCLVLSLLEAPLGATELHCATIEQARPHR